MPKWIQPTGLQHLWLKLLLLAMILLAMAWNQPSQALSLVEAKFNGTTENNNGQTIDGLESATTVAISPDQLHVYVTSFNEGKISIFSRDTTTGQLTFITDVENNVGGVTGLSGAADIVISDDGRNAYVTGRLDDALLTFTRNPATGRLALLDVKRDNIDIDGLDGALSIAISPDSARVYVTALDDHAISVFDRNTLDGSLTLLATLKNGTNITQFSDPTNVIVSNDGVYIYAVSGLDNTIQIFQRSPAVGELGLIGTVANITGLRGGYDLAISPDNNFLYLASNTNPDNNKNDNANTNESALVVFTRNPDGTLTQLKTYKTGGDNITNLSGARNIAISEDGTDLFLTAVNDNAVLEFDRNTTTGLLTFREVTTNTSIAPDSLREPTGIAINSDGKFVYVTGVQSDAITVFTTLNANLAVTVVSNAPVGVNSSLTYDLTITNSGPEEATAVQVTNNIDADVTFVSATPSVGTCSQSAGNSQIIACSLGSLAKDATATIKIIVTTPTTVGDGTLTNVTSVSSGVLDSDTSNNSVTVNSTLQEVVATADLQLKVTTNADASSDVINTGSPLTYTFEVTNVGPDTATNQVLTANLPSGLTFVSADDRCSFETASRVLTCNLSGAVETSFITVETTAPSTVSSSVLTMTASVSADERDSDTSNNNVSKAISVGVLNIDLTVVDVVATPNSVSVGSQISITGNISNSGTTSASGVVLSTTLPAQFSLVDTAGCSENGNKVTCNLGSINNISPNNTKPFALTIQALQAALNQNLTFSVTANGTETNPADNSKTALVTATGQVSDVVVRIEETADPVVLGSTMTYNIIVTNNGPNVTGVTVSSDILGNNAAIGTISSSNGSCTSGFSFICTLEAIGVGQDATIGVDVTPTDLGTITLNTQAVTTTYDPTENSASEQTAVSNLSANLELQLTSLPEDSVLLDNALVYTATIQNNGPSQASNVVYQHTLPAGVELNSVNSTQGQQCTQADDVLTCALGPIANGSKADVYINVQPKTLGELTTRGTVNSDTSDSDASNNTVSLTTTVTQSTANLALTGSVIPESEVLIDNPISFLLNLQNLGEDSASNIVLSVPLPDELTFTPPATVVATQTQATLGTCSEQTDSHTIVCTLTGLAKDASADITLVTLPTQSKDFSVTASVTSSEFDSDATNNSVTLTKRVNSPSTLFPETPTENVANLQRPTAVLVSPDGRFVYVAGFASHSVLVFSRDSSTGSLTFRQSLVNNSQDSNGTVVLGITGASSLAFSPDAQFLYVTGFNDNALAVFRRNAVAGTLEFVEFFTDGNNGIDGLASAFDVEVTQNYVYVASVFDNAITIFQRNTESGQLNFVGMEQESVQLEQVVDLALSADQQYLYAVSPSSDSLLAYSINAETGALSLLQTFTEGVADTTGLDSVNSVVVSDDGTSMYVAADGANNSVSVYARNVSSGVLTFVQTIRDGDDSALGIPVDGLNGVYDVRVSPEGNYVYAAGTTDNAVAIFQRNRNDNGRLAFVDVLRDGVDGVNGIGGARALASSPRGAHIYVAGFFDNAIGLLRVASADLSVSMYDSEDPVQVGQTFNYTMTVTNTGPDRATNVNLVNTLPPNVEVVSVNPQRGGCTPNGNILDCQLGKLDKDETVGLTVVVTTTDIGTLNNQITVSADQVDPTENSLVETTNVLAVADLSIDSFTATPNPAVINVPTTYDISVRNNGTDRATNIVLTHSVESSLNVSSARILKQGNEEQDIPCQVQAPVITCNLPSLDAGAARQYQFSFIPTVADIIQPQITVSSDTLDNQEQNNTASLELVVRLNVIDDTYDNEGQTLTNYTISSTGAVIGGELGGAINNQGLISNATVQEGAVVSGGTLSGTITNNGTIQNVTLASGTTISGSGILQGTITGFASNPARIFGTIASGSILSNVIIGANTVLGDNVTLGSGVSFSSTAQIPAGLDLTNMLPSLLEPLGQLAAVDLRTDIVEGGISILEGINALPDFTSQKSNFIQDATTGRLTLDSTLDGVTENTLLTPIRVSQALAGQTAGVYEADDGSIIVITDAGRAVTLQPAIENPQQLQETLTAGDLRGFKSNTDGTVNILSNTDLYLKVRPSKTTDITDYLKPLGFEPVPTLVNGQVNALFRYVQAFLNQSNEERRQQIFYPAAANQAELRIAIEAIPGVVENSVRFYNDGRVSLKLDKQTFFTMLDPTITQGLASRVTQLVLTPDANGDGSDDVRITYQNGEEQLLYVVPNPEIIGELQLLPELADFTVTALSASQTLFTNNLDNSRRLVWNTANLVVDEDTPTSMDENSNGSVVFTVGSGRQLFTQPAFQDDVAFNAAMTTLFNAQSVIPQLGVAGNISATISETQLIIVRPATLSNVLNLTDTTPLGLTNIGNTLRWVFRDELGVKRQQFAYPAAYQPEALSSFLVNADTESVTFNNNGQVIVDTGAFTFTGVFDMNVQQAGVDPSGGIQFSPVGDINQDGTSDYQVIYADGLAQYIYTVAE
ncbi:beta-propeller fold lactonase family protein [Candidatus Albibeggiatoa sp. nov. NOAA]|uniref:beta-propeller fold lactonase family protein n=1 Tax=Candidatus Albibeggiatoa sp. nov. NOAA TaxID=3162724 RepID=UPI0032F7F2A1|nr:beta-propeller fold lactonase family protein [Thiotrichaceae bacterium]